MEKLQAALERARKTRQEGGPNTLRQDIKASSAASSVLSDDVAARWEALTPFEANATTLRHNRIVTQVANSKATPFDILRTKVLLQMRQNGWKRLAITSPMPDTGKTTTSCNLALGLGRQNDLKTMVLDFDLRDPSVAEFFGQTPKHGIRDVLTGDVDFAEQGLRFGSNVAFGMANQAESDPAKLLLAEETSTAIDLIEDTYQPDLMIFDLPSTLVNDDTRAFLKNVDCALVVIRANKTRYRQFDVAEREIAEQTNVLGVVLNAYRHVDRSGGSD